MDYCLTKMCGSFTNPFPGQRKFNREQKNRTMKFKSIILSLITIVLLASCSTSNNVVGGGIQKRKYNDGYYVSFGKKFNRHIADIQKVETLLSDNDVVETQKTESGTEGLLTKNDEVIVNPEIVSEPKIEEINDDKKIESDNNSVAESSETEISGKNKNVKETEFVETSDKINGTYKAKNISTVVSNSAAASDGVLMLILLVILCFILPPLAVGIFEGITTRFWIDFILWLLGWGVGYWLLGGLGGLCTLIAVIFALLIVLSVI